MLTSAKFFCKLLFIHARNALVQHITKARRPMPVFERSSNDRRRTALERQWQPKQLSERHHNILRLHLLGYSNTDIADKMGCTTVTVSQTINSNIGREHTQMMRSELDKATFDSAKRIKLMAPKAIDVIEEALTNSDIPFSVRLKAAQDALDRAGFGAVKKMDVQSTTVSLTPSDLNNLKQNALLRANENCIEVPCISNSPSKDLAQVPHACPVSPGSTPQSANADTSTNLPEVSVPNLGVSVA